MDSKTRFALVAGVICALSLVFGLRATHKLPPSSFKAFYCAGEAIRDGKNPYAIEPLRSCEHRLAPAALPSYAVEPAPLPGYALAPWSHAARLSPEIARTVYYGILVAALAIAGFAIGQLGRLPPALVMLALSAGWFLNLWYGEPPPIATACIALCALMLARGRFFGAALCAAGVAIEPHLALPLWLALALFARNARFPLAIVGVSLLALDIAIGGPHLALSYVTTTLPSQALAEVFAADQFSLTHVAAVAGLSVPMALRLGVVSYAVMTVAGLLIARRLAQREPEYLALVPPAFVLVGGTFVHDIQFFAALPLALVLLARRVPPIAIATAAAALLAVAWSEATGRLVLLLSASSVFAITWIALPQRAWRVAACAGAAVAALALVIAINHLPSARIGSSPPVPSPQIVLRSTDEAARAWSVYVNTDPSRSISSPRSLARSIPVWGGALLLIVSSLAAARRPRGFAPGAAG